MMTRKHSKQGSVCDHSQVCAYRITSLCM